MSDTGKYEVTCTCQGCVLTLAACYWAGIRRDISYGENQPKVSAVELYFDRYFLTSKTQVPLWLGEPYCFSAVWDVVVLYIFPYISLCKSCSSNENLLKAYIMHLIWAPCWDTLLCHIDMLFFFGATFWTHYQALQRCTALITTDWYWHFFLSVLGLAWLSPLLFFYFFLFFFSLFFCRGRAGVKHKPIISPSKSVHHRSMTRQNSPTVKQAILQRSSQHQPISFTPFNSTAKPRRIQASFRDSKGLELRWNQKSREVPNWEIRACPWSGQGLRFFFFFPRICVRGNVRQIERFSSPLELSV